MLQAAPGGGADPAVALLSAAVSLSQGKTVDADRTLEAFCGQCGSGAAGAPPASAAVAPTLMRAQVGPLQLVWAPQRQRLSGRAVPESGDLSRHRLLALCCASVHWCELGYVRLTCWLHVSHCVGTDLQVT